MKSLEWVMENMGSLKGCLDERFGSRMCQFLTEEQIKKTLNYELKEEYKQNRKVLEWTEENVLKQLKDDVEFGIEKATNHRGISASLMYEVCQSWCKVLENGLENTDYGWYGHLLFEAIDKHYNFGLVDEHTFDEDFFKEW